MLRAVLCSALLAIASVAHAGADNAGTAAGNFLSVGTGASVLSMGGATLASGGDLNAAAWNPASLGLLGASQFSLSHAALAAGQSQDWVAAGGRFGAASTRWSLDALVESDGSFDGRDALGNPTGSFSASNLAFGGHVARPFGEAVVAGAGFEWVHESLASTTGSGLGLDAGVRAQAGEFGFGLAARNLGGRMHYAAASYDLPGVIGVGASWTHPTNGLRFDLDANFPNAYYNDVRAGAEWLWKDRLALRAGYRKELGAPADEPLSGLSFGLGAGAGSVWLDYGFLVNGSDAQGEHRLGLTFRPGSWMHGPASDARRAGASPANAAGPVAKRSAPASPATPPAPAAAANASPATGTPRFTPPAGSTAAATTARPVTPAHASLAASAPARAPKLQLPAASAAHAAKPVAAAKPATAPAGDTVAPTAGAVGVSAAATPPPMVHVVPPTPAKSDAPAKADAVKSDAPAKSDAAPAAPAKSEAAPAAAPAPAAPAIADRPATPEPRPAYVKLGAHETLADLAKRWDTSVAAIMMQNNLVSEKVKPGTRLKLPEPSRR